MSHAPPKARMLPRTCLILLVPLCQSSHAESSLPGLLFITEQLRKPWPSHSSSLRFLPTLLRSQQHTPASGMHPLLWALKPGWDSSLGTRDALRHVPWAGSRSWSSLVIGGVGCLYQQPGCLAAAPATQPGAGGEKGGPHHRHRADAAPRQPLPCSYSAWSFGILPLSYQFLQRMNHLNNYFCLISCLRAAKKRRMLRRRFLTLQDFFDVEDSSQRKYNYSLSFSRNIN